ILTNPAYVGTKVYNRTGRPLQQKHVTKPKSEWIITPNAFKGIVDNETFTKAQERVHANSSARWPKIWPLRKNKFKIIVDMIDWLVSKGATRYDANQIARDLPVLFASDGGSHGARSICFSINEKVRKYTHFIGISIRAQMQPTIEDMFFIPITEISNHLYHLITNENYPSNKIDTANFEDCIRRLARQFRNANPGLSNKFPFLDQL
ncbi:MAG: hypothetical protein EOP48_30605, partial [Sphingobacteriales bacterium]